jgi:hypothetical protein
MVCENRTVGVTLSTDGLDVAGGTTSKVVTFQAAFSITPTATVTISVGTSSDAVAADFNLGIKTLTASAATVSIMADLGSGSTQGGNLNVIAIGRWF